MKPRIRTGAGSSNSAVVGPTSPPSEKPITMRAVTASTGAATPIVAYGGISAWATTAAPIEVKLNVIAAPRPTRSEYAPITIPPIGRVTNPAPNVANDNIKLAYAFSGGKNARPI